LNKETRTEDFKKIVFFIKQRLELMTLKHWIFYSTVTRTNDKKQWFYKQSTYLIPPCLLNVKTVFPNDSGYYGRDEAALDVSKGTCSPTKNIDFR
jgi:hypothetical protein